MKLRCDECGGEIATPFGACPHCNHTGYEGGGAPPPDTVLVLLFWTDYCVMCGVEYGARIREDGYCYCSRCWQVRNS